MTNRGTVHLYRYPHPFIEGKWIYVGQGEKRDGRHRKGTEGFGKRFKKLFPNVELPQPIRWEVPVCNQVEANEEETIAMFQYHTWRGYPGGMNITLPGSMDYSYNGSIAGQNNVENGHLKRLNQGRKNVENGEIKTIATRESCSKGGKLGGRIGGLKGGKTQGNINRNTGHWDRVRLLGASKGGKTGAGGRAGGPIGCCTRWNIRRGKPCTCGRHTVETPSLSS